MADQVGTLLIQDVRREFANQRRLAERAAEQLSDEQFFETLDAEANSVAIIMKHVGGNLRSRWTDFLTTDGEKPDRNRDGEFVSPDDRAQIQRIWTNGWNALDQTFAALTPDDLLGSVTIRGESLPVIQAMNRSLAHTAHHCGQIVLLAKHLSGAKWKTLSIPRGKSSEFLPQAPQLPT